MNFLELLVEKGKLSQKDRSDIDAELVKNRSLADIFKDRNLVLLDILNEVGKEYGLPARVIEDVTVSEEVFKYLPFDSVKHYGFVPLGIVEGVLEVGLTDPDNIESLDALHFISVKTGVPYKTFLITKQDFNRIIKAYQDISGEVGRALSEYDDTESSAAKKINNKKTSNNRDSELFGDDSSGGTGDQQGAIKEDAPVTKIVSTILRYAIDGKSSDIHIEPSREGSRVRFRMDGDLHTSLKLPSTVHEAVVARIKILSKLKLDEKRKPQDGRFSSEVNNKNIDFRVSTFPTEYGEKVVMRILDQSSAKAKVDSIGLTKANLATVREIMKAPYGIILIAGPTGSGKSTTLLTMLSELNSDTKNIVSLEDPVEYEIPGISQSQMRPEIGYTFANGLRSVLRQDPDIIMVGEIRDKETAVLAVQAALTGHLVLSTIHTNTAIGAIPRLIDIGVDPFLIAPTLVAVIGQRLVRQLCPGAGKELKVNESFKLLLEREFADLPKEYQADLPEFKNFYQASPTKECPNGTRGRTAVFEILRMNKKLEEVILTNPVDEKIRVVARESGMLTMREDAIIKALKGEIPFEEINALGGELFDEDQPSM